MSNVYDADSYQDCTGCGVCAAACPQHCITMQRNEDGFLVPQITQYLCVACGRCKAVCRKYVKPKQTDLYEDSKVFAAISKDEDFLKTVSSGGVGAALSEYAAQKGYGVCGVIFNPETGECYHQIAQTVKDLYKIRGSKYLQSQTMPVFQNFEAGKKYMVFGAPCQIWGLRQLLRLEKREEDFILVDLFCKGIPSHLLWESYNQFLNKKIGMDKLKRVEFRDKSVSWHKFSLQNTDQKGRQYSQTLYQDLFMQCFVKNIAFSPACYPCAFRHHESGADIRLGDFWGEKYYAHEEGVSLMVLLSDRGERVWDKISALFWYEQNPTSIVRESQRFDIIEVPKVRAEFIKGLKKQIPLSELYEKYDIGHISIKKGD